MSIQRDLQHRIDQFLFDCGRNNYAPPEIIKAHWAKQQLSYLHEIIEALEHYDPQEIGYYQHNKRTPLTISLYLREYLEERVSRWQTRELVNTAYQEAEAYLQQRGFNASLAPATALPRSQASHYQQEGNDGADPRLVYDSGTSSPSPRRRRRKNYYTGIEELVKKAKV
ncbi:MAG: hypothetical protein AABX13_00845 [Nanoarchaeota archaeon]